MNVHSENQERIAKTRRSSGRRRLRVQTTVRAGALNSYMRFTGETQGGIRPSSDI